MGALSLGFALSLLLALSLPGSAGAQDTRFFRIGTGSAAGTYFPIGSIIAGAISSPPGSRSCEEGGSCGVPGMIAVAQTTNGSVQNIQLIASKQAESGFSQADVAYWAFYGEGMFAKSGRHPELRAVANLYPELVHIVVRKYSGILGIADLAGRRVSLGAQGSGTRLDASAIMAAYGLKADDYEAVREQPGKSADLLREGEIDAFFVVGGMPFPAIEDLAQRSEVLLLPIDGEQASDLVANHPFFVQAKIPDGIYVHVPGVDTLSVGAQWLASAELDADLVYGITRALWHENTRRLLSGGSADGRRISMETALQGIAIPLHEGAARYYREIGMLK